MLATQMVAHDLERPHERPAVGMELGGGNVELGKKLPLKASEGKPKFHLLEQGCVNEAEGSTVVRLVVGANWKVGGQGSTVIFSSCSLWNDW